MIDWSSLRIHLGPGTFSVPKERLTMVPGTHFFLAYLLWVSLIDWLFRNGYQTCSPSGRRHLPVKPSNGVTADQANPSYNDPELHHVVLVINSKGKGEFFSKQMIFLWDARGAEMLYLGIREQSPVLPSFLSPFLSTCNEMKAWHGCWSTVVSD